MVFMKLLASFLLLFFSYQGFAADSLCTSLSGEFLSFKLSSSVFVGNKNSKYFPEIQKSLINKYKNLCNANKNAQTIISEMYQACIMTTMEVVKKEEMKDLHIEACDLAFRVAEAYLEGMDEGRRAVK
jgi:hypothetical protein